MAEQPVLEYATRPSMHPDRTRAHGVLVGVAAGYAFLDLIVMSLTDDVFSVGPIFFWGAMALMVVVLIVGLVARPHPFHPAALAAFAVFMLATAFATIMYLGAVGASV